MLAMKHALTCFYNSFFLESSAHHREEVDGREAFIIPLRGMELIVPLKRSSLLNRHEYTGELLLRTGGSTERISFQASVDALLKDLSPGSLKLRNRVVESVENVAMTLELRKKTLEELFHGSLDFLGTEQALFAGHSFHPAPKSREGFSAVDSRLYAPECGGSFPLRWFWVADECVYQNYSTHFKDVGWIHDLLRNEFPGLPEKPGYIPYPMHPWQAERLLAKTPVKALIMSGQMVEVSSPGGHWAPTSSLRTLYREGARYMLKFSLDVKLTNSVRHMLKHELDRGLQVHEVFLTEEGQDFLSDHPTFQILFEPIYMALKDGDGKPLVESFVMGRENYIKREGEEESVLAVLTQDHPKFQTNLIQLEVERFAGVNDLDWREALELWFKQFLLVAIRPLLKAQAEHGILLGAHQQNLVLALRDHFPVRATFRDCHGTGYSPLGFETFGPLVKSLQVENGNILTHETGNYLFSYYLVINSVFNVMSSLSQGRSNSEPHLLTVFRNFLLELKGEGPKDPSCLDYLLESEELMNKGNFFCSLNEVNENTAENPLSIYRPILNPVLLKERHP